MDANSTQPNQNQTSPKVRSARSAETMQRTLLPDITREGMFDGSTIVARITFHLTRHTRERTRTVLGTSAYAKADTLFTPFPTMIW